MQELSSIAEGAAHLRAADRILIMGCSGGGKSTLAQKIVAFLDLPYVSMDREFFWLPGWVKRDKVEERALIAAKVAEDRWLIDGTGPSSFDLRLPRTRAHTLDTHAALDLHVGRFVEGTAMAGAVAPRHGPRVPRAHRLGVSALHMGLGAEICAKSSGRPGAAWTRCAGLAAEIPRRNASAS